MENEDSISKPNSRLSRIEKLSRRVLDYLQKNPQASDTLEGISAWWLEQQQIEQLVEDVADALELLVKKGIVSACKRPGGFTTYKIKNEKL
jgi:Fe2+ or Zn2+ uptake regulation protein